MLRAIKQFFLDVFWTLTEEEAAIMERDGAWLRQRKYVLRNSAVLAAPLRQETRVAILRNEIEWLQADIRRAQERHEAVKQLRQKLARAVGELLVAVS